MVKVIESDYAIGYTVLGVDLTVTKKPILHILVKSAGTLGMYCAGYMVG
jgi:hypothetical protein